LFFNTYKLDNYLSKEFIDKACQGRIINVYPNLDNLLKEYNELLEEYEFSPILTTYGQIYERTINFPNDNYYTLHWNIDYAKEIIKQLNLQPLNLSVEALVNVVDEDNVDKRYFGMSLQNDEPIIVAYYPLLDGDKHHIILDGNHRVASRYKNSITSVKGYLLMPDEHYHALQSAIDRLLLIIHQNIIALVEFTTGKIEKAELDGMLDNIRKFKNDEEERLQNFFGSGNA